MRVKFYKHYEYLFFVEKPYLIEAKSDFKTLETTKKSDDRDVSLTRTVSAESLKHAIRSGQTVLESEDLQFEEQSA